MKEKTKAKKSLKHNSKKRKALQPICHRSKAAKTDYEEKQPREFSYHDDEGCDCIELDLLMDF